MQLIVDKKRAVVKINNFTSVLFHVKKRYNDITIIVNLSQIYSGI